MEEEQWIIIQIMLALAILYLGGCVYLRGKQEPIGWLMDRIKSFKSKTNTMSELTFGQKAVGLSFNPGGSETVNQIKSQYAGIIDTLNDHRSAATDPEVKRQLSVAITEAQTSQMWAVKAVTWRS